ncbi:MAG: hypothetical protein ACRDIF_04265, partial [Actinomycetota bacterium]
MPDTSLKGEMTSGRGAASPAGAPEDRKEPDSLPAGRGRNVGMAAAVLLAVLLAGYLAWWRLSPAARAPQAPPWRAGALPCRTNPMEHVPRPSRLLLVAKCSTASGTVARSTFDRSDGEAKLFISVDEPFRRYLRPSNAGLLVVEVIPTDQPMVTLPKVGDHATFYGAWVLDRERELWAEIHPAWEIRIDEPAAPTTTPGAQVHPSPTGPDALDVQIRVSESVPVGGSIEVSVEVREKVPGATPPPPIPKVNLFLELLSSEGAAVRWEA